MFINMLFVKNRQNNMTINGANGVFASFYGFAVAFKGLFASNFIYGSPTSVSVS